MEWFVRTDPTADIYQADRTLQFPLDTVCLSGPFNFLFSLTAPDCNTWMVHAYWQHRSNKHSIGRAWRCIPQINVIDISNKRFQRELNVCSCVVSYKFVLMLQLYNSQLANKITNAGLAFNRCSIICWHLGADTGAREEVVSKDMQETTFLT